jgi:hypothetical protein
MSEFTAPQCNVCGQLKGATNNWLKAVTSPLFKGICFVPAESAGERDKDFEYEDICGQACATKRFSLWLTSWMNPQRELGDRASTLELKPPLTRDGRQPSAEAESMRNAI